jgi:hypothetical protein
MRRTLENQMALPWLSPTRAGGITQNPRIPHGTVGYADSNIEQTARLVARWEEGTVEVGPAEYHDVFVDASMASVGHKIPEYRQKDDVSLRG